MKCRKRKHTRIISHESVLFSHNKKDIGNKKKISRISFRKGGLNKVLQIYAEEKYLLSNWSLLSMRFTLQPNDRTNPPKKKTELKRVIVTEYSQRNNWYLVARTRAAQANRVGRRVFALLLLLLKTKLEPATSSTCIPGEGVVVTSPVRAGSRPAFPPPGCTARESWARRRCQ